MYKFLKKVVSQNLASQLKRQLYHHKSEGYSLHRDINCHIWGAPPMIYAFLKTTDRTYYGRQDIQFFKLNVNSIEDGFNELTIQVENSIKQYPQFTYFHQLKLSKYDSQIYLENRDKLSIPEKSDMIKRGMNSKSFEQVNIYEKFSSGLWHISENRPYTYNGPELYDGDLLDGWIKF